MELEHFNKDFVKNTRKRGPAGKHFEVFSPRYSTFWMENLTQWWTQSGPSFKKSGHFLIFKNGREDLPSPSPRPLLNIPLSINIHQYINIPGYSLNIIDNTWINCPDYARALNMHYGLTCLTDFWRCLWF